MPDPATSTRTRGTNRRITVGGNVDFAHDVKKKYLVHAASLHTALLACQYQPTQSQRYTPSRSDYHTSVIELSRDSRLGITGSMVP